MKKILGLDIGGTKCAVILGEVSNKNVSVIDKITFPTNTSKGTKQTLESLFNNITVILKKHSLETTDIKSIGISCGGPLNSKKGIIMSPPNLPGWDNIPIVDLFQDKYGRKTYLQNDANACALAEWKFGAGKGTKNMIFLTFGTGMGAGLILNGKLYSGTNDMAGEVGHIRLNDVGPIGFGKAGSFEGFCSGSGIAQLARSKVIERMNFGQIVNFCISPEEIDSITAQTVADAALKGDDLALEIYKISGTYLGKGLSILIDILNPQVIVIGSIFTRVKELLKPYALKVIKEESITYSQKVCKIAPAKLGESLGDIAALSVAAYNENINFK